MTMSSPQAHSVPSSKISGVIVARNEEDKIAFALESVRSVADEIILFDMESTDRTGEIALSYGAKVTRIPAMGGQEPARPLAVEMAAGPWILMFDADELLSRPLCKRILEIAACDEADAVSLPRQNYLFGKVMTGAFMGANDDRQLRFFKKSSVVVSPLLHRQPTVKAGRRNLDLMFPADGAIVHFNYTDINNYLTKFGRYTRFHALETDANRRYTLTKTLLGAAYDFANRFLRKGGYRDGWRGLYIALSMSFYRITIWAMVHELQEVGSVSDIQAIYKREAETVIQSLSNSRTP